MKSSINLLPKRAEEEILEDRHVAGFRNLAIVLLCLTALTAAGMYFLTSQIPIEELTSEEVSLRQTWESLRPKMARYAFLQDRAKQVEGVLAKRVNMDERLGTILDQIPSDVTIAGVTMSLTSMNFQLRSSSLRRFDEFLDKVLVLEQTKKIVKGVTIETLTLDNKQRVYALTMVIDLL